jgi:septal ring factor EnvC (AmiA/AmiB activator)
MISANYLRVEGDQNPHLAFLYSLTVTNIWRKLSESDNLFIGNPNSIKPKKMAKKNRSAAFIDLMRILTYLSENFQGMTQGVLDSYIAAIREECVSMDDEAHDLRTALSKSDRKCNALADAIHHMAEKNGGLRHRISNLQSIIAKLKQPAEIQNLKVAENENGEPVWLAEGS